jgi:hypothetical protein
MDWFGTAVCALALAGYPTVPPVEDPPTRGSAESPRPYYPSSGLTLEALQALPSAYASWFPRPPALRAYQPYPIASPFYNFNTPATSYAYPFGLGGYRPPGVGGYYRNSFSWWGW